MSAGKSVRNETSVEPGLPKIVVIPQRRITSNVASRTVAPAASAVPVSAEPAPVSLANVSVITTFDHTADVCAVNVLVFA